MALHYSYFFSIQIINDCMYDVKVKQSATGLPCIDKIVRPSLALVVESGKWSTDAMERPGRCSTYERETARPKIGCKSVIFLLPLSSFLRELFGVQGLTFSLRAGRYTGLSPPSWPLRHALSALHVFLTFARIRFPRGVNGRLSRFHWIRPNPTVQPRS
jgi:hypothetical protein